MKYPKFKILAYSLFITIGAHAASPGQVCEKITNSLVKNDCLAVINQARYLDPNAVNSCYNGAGSNGFTIVDCMKAISDKSYAPAVAQGCSNSNGLVTTDCLKKNGHPFSDSIAISAPPVPMPQPRVQTQAIHSDNMQLSLSINVSGNMTNAMAALSPMVGTPCDPNVFKPGYELLSRSIDQNGRSLGQITTLIDIYIASLEGKIVLSGGTLDPLASQTFWQTMNSLNNSAFSRYPHETEMLLLNTVKGVRGYALLLESILETRPSVKASKTAQFENICRTGTE